MRHRATPPTDHVRPHGRRRVRPVLAAAVVVWSVLGIGGAPAWAADDRTVVESVVDDVRPALPAGSQVAMTQVGELTATGSSDVPLAVAAPDGRDFLRISARGVDLDAAHPFTYESRTPPGAAARSPEGVAPGAPPRWVHVTDATSWRWFDPRTTPGAVGAPAGGRPGTTQVLGTWTVPLHQGDGSFTVDGRLVRRQPSGTVRTTADPAPDGLTAIVSPGARPSLILQGPAERPVTVLGLDGEPFLRRAADGSWEADTASRTYRLGLLRDGGPVPPVGGWVPYAPAGSVSWSDDRLRPPQAALDAANSDAVPAEVWRWQIPVLVGDRQEALTGTVRYDPYPGVAGGSGSAALTSAGLGGAVLALAAALVFLVRRNRRTSADTDPDADPDADPETDAPVDDLVPPREGAPLS